MFLNLRDCCSHTAARKCTGKVTDQDDVVNGTDDAVGDLEALEILELEELFVDLTDHD
jgi:hypothetical protein